MTGGIVDSATAPLAEAILDKYRLALGSDFRAYRGHVLRVRALAHELGWTRSDALLQVAAATHDLAVWTDDTVDYLEPSAALAEVEAVARGFDDNDRDVLRQAVVNHHKITATAQGVDPAVEVFRRADWIDVTRGRLRFGVKPFEIARIRTSMPDDGFAAMLRGLMRRSWRERPWRLPPMIRF